MLKAIRLLSLASLLLLARADTNSLSLPLTVFDAGMNGACNATGTMTMVQIGPIPSGTSPQLLDVNPFNFGQLTVQITPDTAVIGAPFQYGDLVTVYGQWDGTECVASILEKQ